MGREPEDCLHLHSSCAEASLVLQEPCRVVQLQLSVQVEAGAHSQVLRLTAVLQPGLKLQCGPAASPKVRPCQPGVGIWECVVEVLRCKVRSA